MIGFDSAPAHLRVAAYDDNPLRQSRGAADLPQNNPYFVEKKEE